MSQEVISGPSGSGKTLLVVHWIVEEFVKGTRTVVTNVALKIPELSAYVVAKGGKWDSARLVHLKGADEYKLREWWNLTKGPSLIVIDEAAVILPKTFAKTTRASKKAAVGPGVDTVQLAYKKRLRYVSPIEFNPDDWTYWSSLHRKEFHDILILTVDTMLLHKVCAANVQWWVLVRNFGLGVKWGAGIDGKFGYAKFNNSAHTGPSSHNDIYHVDVKGIGNCYKSEAGVGFIGVGDTKRRKLPDLRVRLAIVAMAMVCVGLMLAYGSPLLGKVVSRTLLSGIDPFASRGNKVATLQEITPFHEETQEPILLYSRFDPVEPTNHVKVVSIQTQPVKVWRWATSRFDWQGVTEWTLNDGSVVKTPIGTVVDFDKAGL